MASPANRTTRHSDRSGEPLLVAEAGMPYTALPDGDPVAGWLDLMEAVEALCPEWPAPEPKIWYDYRL